MKSKILEIFSVKLQVFTMKTIGSHIYLWQYLNAYVDLFSRILLIGCFYEWPSKL